MSIWNPRLLYPAIAAAVARSNSSHEYGFASTAAFRAVKKRRQMAKASRRANR